MWVEMVKPDKTRMLLNLDVTFCFDEQLDGTTNAVSITGIGVPTGMPYAMVSTEIMKQED